MRGAWSERVQVVERGAGLDDLFEVISTATVSYTYIPHLLRRTFAIHALLGDEPAKMSRNTTF